TAELPTFIWTRVRGGDGEIAPGNRYCGRRGAGQTVRRVIDIEIQLRELYLRDWKRPVSIKHAINEQAPLRRQYQQIKLADIQIEVDHPSGKGFENLTQTNRETPIEIGRDFHRRRVWRVNCGKIDFDVEPRRSFTTAQEDGAAHFTIQYGRIERGED